MSDRINYCSFLLALDWFSLHSFMLTYIAVQYITLFSVTVLTDGKKGEALKLH